MGEGISEGIEEELQENNIPMNNVNDLEDQPAGNNIEEEECPMEEESTLQIMNTVLPIQHLCLVGLAKTQHALLKKLGKLH